jgi:hypothetical protein
MESHYNLASVALKIEHSGDDFFRKMDDELKYYRAGAGPHDCLARFSRSEGWNIPEKAVRTNVLNNACVYLHEGRLYIADKDGRFLIRMAVGEKELSVDYRSDCTGLHELMRWLLKWLVIKSAEGKGLAFIHASAASYKGRTIVFCGDSKCGKSSSLMRLIQSGATAISDDSVLSDGTRIFPFTLKTGVDEDFARRFGVDPGLFDIGRHAEHKSVYGKADCVIFLRIWNSSASEIRPLEYNKALLGLIRIYKKEIPFLWSGLERDAADGSAAIFKRYASILENARCFEFFQGSDEGEVRGALLRFIDGIIGA